MESPLRIENAGPMTGDNMTDATIWSYMQAEELLSSTLTLRDLLRKLHDPKRLIAERNLLRPTRCCCAHGRKSRTPLSPPGCEYFDVNGNHRQSKNFFDKTDQEFELSHSDCPRFNQLGSCNHCKECQAELYGNKTVKPETVQAIKKKQKNDRQAILQKLTTEDNDSDNFLFGSNKPWYNPRLERGNSQNLQICYINDSCSSSDNDDTTSDSKTSPSSKSGGKSSPMSSPALPSPGFGMRRNMLYRMPSSSSTISVSSTSSNQNSSSSLPNDGEVINIRSSINTDDIPKVRTKQEELEFQARIAITQAHQEAKRLAEQERRKSRKEGSSFEKLLQTPLDDVTRTKVKTRTLTKTDCGSMTIGQLQVILNNMHMEKEALNSELKTILESRDELRTEQDAKLMDVDDMKAMLAVTGPETTV